MTASSDPRKSKHQHLTVTDSYEWYLDFAVGAFAPSTPPPLPPGKLADVLLHETAVAWIRKKEETSRITTPWTETVAQFTTRLKTIVQGINTTHDVEGLCRQLPRRLEKLVDGDGERLQY